MDGLKVLVNTIVSPKEAFEALRERSTWVWALMISVVVGSVCTYLMAPAFSHAMLANPAAIFGDKAAQMTPDQIQTYAQAGAKVTSFYFIGVLIGVPIICLIGGLVMTLFNALGRGDGSFAKYFAAQCNIGVVGAIGTVVGAIIILVRGTDSFNSLHEVATAAPSLAWLIPGAGVKVSAFLGVMTPFTLWATALTAYAMTIIGKVPRLQAWLAALIMLIFPALLAAWGAK